MKTLNRKYKVGVDIIRVKDNVVTIRPYTEIDGDRLLQEPIQVIAGDAFEFDYTRKIEYTDTVDLGDRTWVAKRSQNN